MMVLVRRLMGGGAFLGTASVVALVFVACANGTNVGYVGDDEAGLLLDSGGRDVNVLPTGDSAPVDGATGGDSGNTGCTGTIVINELKTDGATASDEFVELYNPNSCAVPLSGWALKYESSSGATGGAGYVFVAGDSIPAQGYFLIASSTFSGKKDATLINGFAAAAGQVGLVDDKNTTIDGVAYGTVTGGSYGEKQSATAPPTNKSIGRLPNGTDTNSNSADFKVLTSPSPGAAN